MSEIDDIVREFLVESHEGLDRPDRDLATLEQRPRDRELLAGIFRCAHTQVTTNPGAPWPPPGVPVLDPAAVAALRELADDQSPELLKEIAGLFLSDAQERLRLLDGALGEGRLEDTRRVAHTLKGAALVMGTTRLAVACRGLESAAAAGWADAAGLWWNRIPVEYDLAADALRRALLRMEHP